MRTKGIFCGIVILLLCCALSSGAADWHNYIEDRDGGRVYVDMESIELAPGNTIRVVKKVEPSGTTAVASVVSVVEMDCEKYMIRYLKETTYYKGGKTRTSSKSKRFRKVTVEDDDESLMELVCSLKKSK